MAVARALVLAGDAALLQQVDVDVRAAHLVRLVYSTRAVARLAILWLYLLRLHSRWLSSLVRAWSNCISMKLYSLERLYLLWRLVELYLDELAEAGAVVVAARLGVTEGLEERVGGEHLLRDEVGVARLAHRGQVAHHDLHSLRLAW